jgi:phage gpG-like protein
MTEQDVKNLLLQQINSLLVKKLRIVEAEAKRSIQRNFEEGGRPKWIPSKKKGKLRGTKTLVVTGALSEISSTIDDDKLLVTLFTSPKSSAYARAQQEGATINMPGRNIRFRSKHYKDGSVRTVFAGRKHKKTFEKAVKPYVIVIPARPFMVIPPEDLQNIIERINQ